MAGDLGTLFVKVDAETKDYNKKIDAAGKKTEKFAKDLKKFGDNAFKFATLPILGLGIASLKFASDAEEANAKFNTAFKGIEDQAKTTAEALAENYGLAIFQSEKLLGNTGDLLKGFGATATEALGFSNEIQELSVDLASYNNVVGGAERVSKILTKSVLGNKDGLSELGVVLLDTDINQELVRRGQEDLTGQAKLLAKAQATYSLILKQTGDAQGDYARTQDGIANRTKELVARTKDLAIVFGNELLPIAGEIVGVALDAVKAFTSLSDTNKDIIITVAGITAVIAPAIKAVNGLKTAFTGLNGAIGLVLLAVTGLVAGIKKLEELDARRQEETFGSIAESTGQTVTDLKTIADISTGLITRANSIAEGFNIAQQNSGLTKKQLFEVLKLSGNLTQAQLKYIKTLTVSAKTTQELIRLSLDRAEALELVRKESKELSDAEAKALEEKLAAEKKLQEELTTILEEEKKDIKDKLLEELQAQQAFDAETRSIRKNVANEIEAQNQQEIADEERKLDEKRDLQKQYLDATLDAARSLLQIANQQSNEEIRILENQLKTEIEINDKLLKDAIETNNQLLAADLKLNSDKLNLQLEAFNAETQGELALRDFKNNLAEEARAFDIKKTQEKINELLATGEIEDAEEARRLEKKLANDEALRVLQDQANTDELQRIKNITTAEAEAEAERLTIQKDADEANKTLLEAQATEETRIKQDTANKVYKIELAQFQANKAIAGIEAGINTALAVTAALPNLILAGLVGGAGLVQIGAILSAPEPAKPQFAAGGSVSGATSIIAGEDKGDVLLGMGAKGQPLFNEMIARLSDGINNANGNAGQTVVNFNSMVNVTDPQQLRFFAQTITPFIEEVQEGRQ